MANRPCLDGIFHVNIHAGSWEACKGTMRFFCGCPPSGGNSIPAESDDPVCHLPVPRCGRYTLKKLVPMPFMQGQRDRVQGFHKVRPREVVHYLGPVPIHQGTGLLSAEQALRGSFPAMWH